MRSSSVVVLVLTVALGTFAASPLRALVFSEIHYNPPSGSESLEFIEITNETWTPDDLSGYRLVGGVTFVFPPATILPGRASLVVCADPEAIKAHYGLDESIVYGPFGGRLDSGGEQVTLLNHVGIRVQRVQFRDSGKWPVAPDGTGHTLVLKALHLEPKEPESWEQSPELGGSPGRPNFPDQREIEFEVTTYMGADVEWRYRKGTGPFSDPPDAWTAEDFDDGDWEIGQAGFGFGEDDLEIRTVFEDMRRNYGSVAIRRRFELTEEQLNADGDIFLGMWYDDGFCVYINGATATGGNCPDEVTFDAQASRSREANSEDLFLLDKTQLRVGENLIAIVGFNRTVGSSDFVMIPRIINRRALLDSPPIESSVRFNELLRGSGKGDGWIELYNAGTSAVDLSGARLTDNPDRPNPYVFPAGSMLAGGGFLVVSEAETGLDFSTPKVRAFLLHTDDRVLAAAAFERTFDAAEGPWAEARFPDGSLREWVTETPTPGAANVVPANTDLVINEIYYHPPEYPFDEPRSEFVELYNRGTEPVDASGFRFTKGLDYMIPAGTTVPPGEYLVIAQDPGLLSKHYGYDGALGPYEGVLANGGENLRLVDAVGNLVDEVRYYEGGRWPIWADGRGASLELIDPHQDNDVASAWEASDESEKTAWQQLTYEVEQYAPAGESELHILLAEKGICRIDDVSIVRAGDDDNIIPNPGFEDNTRPWRIEGTHVDSERITDDSHGGEACLEVVATGKGDSLCNRIETDTNPRMTRAAYTVSLWARWVRGSNLMILHGEFAPGPWFGTRDNNMSNNSLGARLWMDVPLNIGTPGEENSVTRQLREATGSVNLGPVISDVRHDPPIPDENFPVTVTARVSDSNGVARVVAQIKRDTSNEDFQAVELFDDGAHDDGAAGDGFYGGRVGVFPANATVVFYVEAADTTGKVRTFPVDAPQEQLTFTTGQVAEEIFIAQNSDSTRELSARPLHSNDLVDATFIYDNSEIYYNVGIRYRGSPWGRPQRQSYRMAWAKDKPFLGGRKTMNLSNRDRNDGAAHFMVSRNSTPQSIAPASDYRYIRARINRQSFGQPGFFDTVDRDFISKWYGSEAAEDAVVLKGNGRLRFNDGCTRTGWDEATTLHMDDYSENYRFYYNHSVNQTRDNWLPWMELTRTIDRRTSSNEELDANIESILNVEKFFRVLGARIIMNDGDALYVGNGHNGYLVWDPTDGEKGRFSYLPFDLGFSFNGGAGSFFTARDRGVARLLARPKVRRKYLGTMHEYMNGYWNDQVAGPYLDELQRAARVGATAKNFLRTTRPRFISSLRSFTEVDMEIRTNDGADFTTEEESVLIEGLAPVQVARFLLQRNDGERIPFEPEFPSSRLTQWETIFALAPGENRLTIFGMDTVGDLVGIVSVTITREVEGVPFIRGDLNRDARVGIDDAVAILLHLFGGQRTSCPDAADVNDSGTVELTDAVQLLQFLFLRGDPPAAPFPNEGPDPTPEDVLACE